MKPVDRLLDRLPDARQNGTGWHARCPAHDDRSPSLSVSEGDDGRALVHCHAGCEHAAVLAALGLTDADLFPASNGNGTGRRIVATYTYVDANGEVVMQVVRYSPKAFRQRRPDGRGGWEWRGGKPILYRLPELLAADPDEAVYICEGEKDVDALVRAGAIATCGPGGAGKWAKVAAQARDVLARRTVFVVADKDEPGYRHAADVARSLRGVADEVIVVEAAKGKDAADHLAAGLGLDQLVNVDPEHVDPDEEHRDDPDDVLVGIAWQARPVLLHVRQAAQARMVSPEALLLAVLANVAAHIPPAVVLPAWPRHGHLNLLLGIVGPPGAAKGSTLDVAAELVPVPDAEVVPLGSGEGLVRSFWQPADKGKMQRHKRPVIGRTDEVGTLAALTSRRGDTLTSMLKQSWSGERLGFGYAATEKRLPVEPRTYRLVVLVGVAPEKAAPLFTDQGGGLPERILFAPAVDPDLPDFDHLPEWPGSLGWERPRELPPAKAGAFEFTVDPAVADEVQRARHARATGAVVVDPLEVHLDLNRLKVAALLAVLDGRWHVSGEDWTLADGVVAVHRRTRDRLLDTIHAVDERTEEVRRRRHAEREVAADAAVERRRVVDCARRVALRVWDANDGLLVTELRRSLGRNDRENLSDGIAHAVAERWIVEQSERGQGQDRRRLTRGKSRPT